jgi:hypothetical protein
MHQAGEADPSGTPENPNKPDIHKVSAWLLGERVELAEWPDHSMQQCRRTQGSSSTFTLGSSSRKGPESVARIAQPRRRQHHTT